MPAALALARRGLGNVWPNPSVGCVVVRDDGGGPVVVGRGWTQPGGRPHAVTEALARAGAAARGATAFVSLEPCNHHGRTPPCTEALIAAGIARVVAATEDPDPRVNGGGLRRLAEAGIAVECGVLRGEAELEEAVQPTQAPDLWLLPAGKCDLQSVQSLAAQKAREVCEKLRARFDFIILDSGPVLAYADTMLLGQIVDAAILSVLRDVSRAPKVYEAYEKLVSVNVDVLGAVVGGEATYTPRRRLPLAVSNSQH